MRKFLKTKLRIENSFTGNDERGKSDFVDFSEPVYTTNGNVPSVRLDRIRFRSLTFRSTPMKIPSAKS